MSLLVAGIVLLLFIFLFGEIADRFPDDSGSNGDGLDRRPKKYRFD